MSSITIPTDAAKINAQLRDLGHRTWGFVIYRCTYADDAEWQRFLDMASARADDDLGAEPSDGQDGTSDQLRRAFRWKVFDDRTRLDGASKDQVRAHFVTWCASDEAKAEQYGDSDAGRPETMLGTTPRYTYPIHVDADALRSVLHEAPQHPEPDVKGVGWVAVVDAFWELPGKDTPGYEDTADDEEFDPADEGEEPVEGCRMYEVGWMRMGAQAMGTSAYAFLRKSGMFNVAYKRPPEVWIR